MNYKSGAMSAIVYEAGSLYQFKNELSPWLF